MVKKVVVTEDKFKEYWNEIQQSYELGFTPYRLHKNTDGTFLTPNATMEVGDQDLTTDTINSKLV